jgi:hypothetical protein
MGGKGNPDAESDIVNGGVPLVNTNEKLAHSPGQRLPLPDNDPTGPSFAITVTVCSSGQTPDVMYLTLYVVPPTAFVITPVDAFITAPSPGAGSKLKVPPNVMIPNAAPEVGAQKLLILKEGSS